MLLLRNITLHLLYSNEGGNTLCFAVEGDKKNIWSSQMYTVEVTLGQTVKIKIQLFLSLKAWLKKLLNISISHMTMAGPAGLDQLNKCIEVLRTLSRIHNALNKFDQ